MQTPLVPVPTGAWSLSLLLTPEQDSYGLSESSCSSSHSSSFKFPLMQMPLVKFAIKQIHPAGGHSLPPA